MHLVQMVWKSLRTLLEPQVEDLTSWVPLHPHPPHQAWARVLLSRRCCKMSI